MRTFPPATKGAAPRAEQVLIPDKTIFSSLLEDLRLERASYKILQADAFPCESMCNIDELHGFFFQSGQVRFSFKDDLPIEARRRDYVLIGHNTSYLIETLAKSGPCSLVVETFKLDNSIGRLLLGLLPNVLVVNDMSGEEYEWHSAIGRLVTHHPKCIEDASSAINHRLIEASLISIIQSWLHTNPPPGLLFDSPSTVRMLPSLRAMHRAPEKPWTISTLAALSGMSRSSFTSLFRTVAGATVARYLTTLRLDRAKELLKLQQLTLSEVAQRSGFAADTAFIRAFKRQFGSTPGKFRAP